MPEWADCAVPELIQMPRLLRRIFKNDHDNMILWQGECVPVGHDQLNYECGQADFSASILNLGENETTSINK